MIVSSTWQKLHHLTLFFPSFTPKWIKKKCILHQSEQNKEESQKKEKAEMQWSQINLQCWNWQLLGSCAWPNFLLRLKKMIWLIILHPLTKVSTLPFWISHLMEFGITSCIPSIESNFPNSWLKLLYNCANPSMRSTSHLIILANVLPIKKWDMSP